MKNVYDEVRNFYEQELVLEPVIKRDWVEGYLRQKAWQGASDDSLRPLWNHIRAFAMYLEASETDYTGYLEEVPAIEYTLVIQWMLEHVSGFRKNLKTVRQFFDSLLDFFKYLAGRKLIADCDELETAAKEIAGGKKLELFPPSLGDFDTLFDESGDSGIKQPDFGVKAMALGKAVERLMSKLGSYFQQKEFADDFHRALLLFNGPLEPLPTEERDEFWLGFWDYFLFDYHLLLTDSIPLAHFQAGFRNRLTAEERQILDELLSARFCVFYIDHVINHDWVECINLFTEERFRLPHPQFHYKQIKKMLFFGHVFSRENIMVNYVTSLEVSANLRRRIKQEVSRQKALFNIQEPAGSWEDMLARHALAVRHTIDLLATMAKVNVTPFHQIDRSYPVPGPKAVANEEVIQALTRQMPEYAFSRYDIELACRMWRDFCQLGKVIVRKPEVWAAAVMVAFSQINGFRTIPIEQLAIDLGISAGGIYTNRGKLFDILELQKFDPRYVNEEGFVLSLFDFL